MRRLGRTGTGGSRPRRHASSLIGLAALALAGLALVSAAAPAAAHARLVSSRPADGDRFDQPPGSLVLRFSEAVELASGDLRVYDGAGRRLAHGPARHHDGDHRSIWVDLPRLGDGAHVAVWRLASADGHVVRGALTFFVGPVPAARTDDLVRRLLAAQGEDPVTGALVVANRAIGFAALAVAVGGLGFMLWVWPAGRDRPHPRRVVRIALVAAGASAAAGVGLHGSAARGLAAVDAARLSVVADVLSTRFGQLSLARLALLALAAGALARPGAGRWRLAAAAGGGAVVTVALAGHAASGPWVALAVPTHAAHLAALGLWLGGLVMLLVCIVRQAGWPGATPDDRLAVAGRFSTLAFASVVVVVVTGTVQAVRQVGSLPALTGTTYGRVLLVKVALVLALVAAGAASRSALWRQRATAARPAAAPATVAAAPGPGGGAAPAPLPARTPAQDVGQPNLLGRLVGREIALGAAVLVAAGLLVNAVPARLDYGRPFSATLEAGPVAVDLTIDPARAGPVDVHLYSLSPGGQVADVEGMAAELSLPARDVGPLVVPLRRAGPGHFAAYAFRVPYPGEWELSLAVQVGGATVPTSARVPVK